MKAQTTALVATLSFVCLALVIGYFVAPPLSRGLSITRLSSNGTSAHFRFRSSSGKVRIVHSKWSSLSHPGAADNDLSFQVIPIDSQAEKAVSAPGTIKILQHDNAIEVMSEQQVLFRKSVSPGHRLASVRLGANQTGIPGVVLDFVSFVVQDENQAISSKESFGLAWEPLVVFDLANSMPDLFRGTA